MKGRPSLELNPLQFTKQFSIDQIVQTPRKKIKDLPLTLRVSHSSSPSPNDKNITPVKMGSHTSRFEFSGSILRSPSFKNINNDSNLNTNEGRLTFGSSHINDNRLPFANLNHNHFQSDSQSNDVPKNLNFSESIRTIVNKMSSNNKTMFNKFIQFKANFKTPVTEELFASFYKYAESSWKNVN